MPVFYATAGRPGPTELLQRREPLPAAQITDRTKVEPNYLARVKQSGGLSPICVYCTKIRDDKGYWEHLEGYISKHSEALFNHGICPARLEQVKAEWGM